MYANLAVTIGGPHDARRINAWRVETDPDGTVRVFTDLNDGGNYAEEGPEETFPAGTRVRVEASF